MIARSQNALVIQVSGRCQQTVPSTNSCEGHFCLDPGLMLSLLSYKEKSIFSTLNMQYL